MSSDQVGGPPAFVHLLAHPLRWRLLTELADSDYRVRELVTLVGQPQNLVSYHLRLLRDGGLVTTARSSLDARDSYYHLDLDHCAVALTRAAAALHPALRMDRTGLSQPLPRGSRRLAVLFVCTGNSARSPIAEALLRHHTAGRLRVASAGNVPKPELHPHATRVLRDQFDIDISGQRPRHVKTVTRHRFDYVISLCDKAREACPEFPHQPRLIHWSVRDPAAADSTRTDAGLPAGYTAFQAVAADIDTRVRHLLPVLAASEPQEVRS
jgi:ArsR family transcriptional regulator, arsenate/arsenite/antimonite-responsive transcriptional repressor / arsenate reductase (thioredoxin)